MYGDEPAAEEPAEEPADEDANLLKSAAPKPPAEDLSEVSQNEMEEYADKLHDRAGAGKMFTEEDSSRVQLKQQQGAPAPTTPNAMPKGRFALTEKNLYHAAPTTTAQPSKKRGSGESMFVAENTKAWAKLPKDFSPNTLGGMSVNPAAPDFRQMGTAEYSQLFHDAADSATKEFDRPYDVLLKESEEKEKRRKNDDDEYNLPDMKDVLVQMRLADDTDLLITEDEDDKKHSHKHAKKGGDGKIEPVSLADAMSYSNAMADQSNGVHGFESQKRPMAGEQQQQEKTQLIEKSNEHYQKKKNFYEQILDQEKQQDPEAVHKLAQQERENEKAMNPKHKKSTFEEIQDGNAPSLSKTSNSKSAWDVEPCETCPYDLSSDLVQLHQNDVLRYFNYI